MSFLHNNHKRLWLHLHQTGGEVKSSVIKKLKMPPAEGYCYACESVNGKGGCKICPIDWDGLGGNCDSKNSTFRLWNNSQDRQERSKLALQIAHMDWREI
jgi:hypothetical protein